MAAVVVLCVVSIAAGCGGDDARPREATGATSTAPTTDRVALPAPEVRPGGQVQAGRGTPAPVAAALRGNRVVVVAFLMAAPADDRAVARALAQVRADPAYRRAAQFFTYRVAADGGFGDLADQLGVTGTPAVAVIGRDRRLTNRFEGLADATMIRQAINDAAATAAHTPIP